MKISLKNTTFIRLPRGNPKQMEYIQSVYVHIHMYVYKSLQCIFVCTYVCLLSPPSPQFHRLFAPLFNPIFIFNI